MSPLWNYFDKIILMTIPTSQRVPLARKQLAKMGIDNYKVKTFKPAQKKCNNGTGDITLLQILKHEVCDETCQNIAQNHFSIIEQAYKDNVQNLLIMEDDITFEKIDHDRLYKTILWLSNNNWDIFYFGYCSWPILCSIPVTLQIVRVFTPLTAVCYALNRQGMEKILKEKEYYQQQHIDKFYTNKKLIKYALFPAIAFQSEGPGLYYVAMKKLGLDISFTTLSKILEVMSILVFVILILVLIFIIYKIKNLYK